MEMQRMMRRIHFLLAVVWFCIFVCFSYAQSASGEVAGSDQSELSPAVASQIEAIKGGVALTCFDDVKCSNLIESSFNLKGNLPPISIDDDKLWALALAQAGKAQSDEVNFYVGGIQKFDSSKVLPVFFNGPEGLFVAKYEAGPFSKQLFKAIESLKSNPKWADNSYGFAKFTLSPDGENLELTTSLAGNGGTTPTISFARPAASQISQATFSLAAAKKSSSPDVASIIPDASAFLKLFERTASLESSLEDSRKLNEAQFKNVLDSIGQMERNFDQKFVTPSTLFGYLVGLLAVIGGLFAIYDRLPKTNNRKSK